MKWAPPSWKLREIWSARFGKYELLVRRGPGQTEWNPFEWAVYAPGEVMIANGYKNSFKAAEQAAVAAAERMDPWQERVGE